MGLAARCARDALPVYLRHCVLAAEKPPGPSRPTRSSTRRGWWGARRRCAHFAAAAARVAATRPPPSSPGRCIVDNKKIQAASSPTSGSMPAASVSSPMWRACEVVDAQRPISSMRATIWFDMLEARLPACGFAGRFPASRRRRESFLFRISVARDGRDDGWLTDAGGAHLLEQVRDEGRQVLGVGRRFRLHDDSCNALRRHRRAPLSLRCAWQLKFVLCQHAATVRTVDLSGRALRQKAE